MIRVVHATRMLVIGVVDLVLDFTFIGALWHLLAPDRWHFASTPDLVVVMITCIFVMVFDGRMQRRVGE